MRDELMGFQKKAVAALLSGLSSAVSYHNVDGRPQVIAFRAPTGSGKTIVMATVIEDVLCGNETRIEQPEADLCLALRFSATERAVEDEDHPEGRQDSARPVHHDQR